MHNLSGTALVHDGSVPIPMGRRASHNGQHRSLCGTDIAHNSALRTHFHKSEEADGSEQRRALTTKSHSCTVLCNMTVTRFFFQQLASDAPPPPPRGGEWTRVGLGWVGLGQGLA